jgi:hypothetical protein
MDGSDIVTEPSKMCSQFLYIENENSFCPLHNRRARVMHTGWGTWQYLVTRQEQVPIDGQYLIKQKVPDSSGMFRTSNNRIDTFSIFTGGKV